MNIETNCSHCNVPLELHGTECGWINAKTPVDQNFIVTDSRHPGFGKHLNRWKGSYIEDGDGYDISQSIGFQIGYDQATNDMMDKYANILKEQNAIFSKRYKKQRGS